MSFVVYFISKLTAFAIYKGIYPPTSCYIFPNSDFPGMHIITLTTEPILKRNSCHQHMGISKNWEQKKNVANLFIYLEMGSLVVQSGLEITV